MKWGCSGRKVATTRLRWFLRTWERQTLLDSLPWLRSQNSQGRKIFIRPAGEHRLSLVDDLTTMAVRRMKEGGFTPAVVVETWIGAISAGFRGSPALPSLVSVCNFGGRQYLGQIAELGQVLTSFGARNHDHQSPV